MGEGVAGLLVQAQLGQHADHVQGHPHSSGKYSKQGCSPMQVLPCLRHAVDKNNMIGVLASSTSVGAQQLLYRCFQFAGGEVTRGGILTGST